MERKATIIDLPCLNLPLYAQYDVPRQNTCLFVFYTLRSILGLVPPPFFSVLICTSSLESPLPAQFDSY